MSKALELARKLQALAKKGVGGEADNAKRFLDELCAKHGISIEELEEDAVKGHDIKLKTEEENTFFCQIVSSVLGKDYKLLIWKNAKKRYVCHELHCTQAEWIEIEAKYRHYWKDYHKQLRAFYIAYINKNELTAKPSADSPERDAFTEEEKMALIMMQGIKRSDYHIQIDKQ